MKGQPKKQLKRENLEKYISLLEEKGYKPVVQPKCWYHFKDGVWNFYPTTGTYYNDETQEKGKIVDLPNKSVAEPNKYYNLDKRFLPDWVLDPNRQEMLNKFVK